MSARDITSKLTKAGRLVWHEMGLYELAQSMRTNLVIHPGRHGGFDLFDSASLLG